MRTVAANELNINTAN